MSAAPLLVCVAFNCGVGQLFAWMWHANDRESYEREARAVIERERAGLHARRVHVAGPPGVAVRLGASHDDGWPAGEQDAALLTSEALELIDDSGKVWELAPGVSLRVSGVRGTRELVDPEVFDFRILPEQTFYVLVTEAGIAPEPCFSDAPERFELEAKPRGMFAAWILAPLTWLMFWLLREELEFSSFEIGLAMLNCGMFLFVCLQGSLFELPFPRFRTKQPHLRWRPELR